MSGPLLQLQQVSVRFGGLTALHAFDLTLNQGELCGLVGPNGAGKTTALDVLCGLVAPTEGRVVLDGRDITGLPLHALARLGIGRTFQTVRLFESLSVLDHARVACDRHRRAHPLLCLLPSGAFRRDEAALTERARALLELVGLAHRCDEPASGLTLADQRRLALVRSLALAPRLLLLDEPAAGLDAEERRAFGQLIRRVRQQFNLTILLAEHSMRIVMDVCDRLVVLDNGTRIAEGPPAVVREDPQVITAYLGEDFRPPPVSP